MEHNLFLGTSAAFGLALLSTLVVVFLHFEGLQLLDRLPFRKARLRIVLTIWGIILIHVLETMVFAASYWTGEALGLGRFVGTHTITPVFFFYFSLETFTTQALGDVYPVGPMRMIASIEPLVGLILIGWSTSFTFVSLGARLRARGTSNPPLAAKP